LKKYFHDPVHRTLYVAPAEPNVSEKKDRNGYITMTTVSARIQGSRFTYTGLQEDASYTAKEFYESRDSRAQAIEFFKASNYPLGEISASDYSQLYTNYTSSDKTINTKN
jgi:hypothetical protein